MTVLRPEGSDPPEPAPEERKSRWSATDLRRKLLVSTAVLWAVALTAFVVVRLGVENEAPSAAAPSAAPSASAAPLTVAEVYQALAPSVVLIRSTGQTDAGTGTGVIANADGTIITALHVVEGAQSIELTYADGTKSAAAIARADPKQDIATLTPQKLPETLVPAIMGGGSAVGDDVVAIGNPLGLTWSTSSGVVSGLDRRLDRAGKSAIEGLIQFDAAVNPGNSGGPLINTRGQVTGIVVALANPTDAGTFIGIGFAVPIGAALGGGEGDGQAPPL
ncbi:trypsin-like peptidase domain-containing protein [Actinoplanes sp. NEAU-A11]|uniref:Trypsin-like peptidase domain-containing protein n=2 Tax=Actinoplanes aureus TaxID=2792083 RepID=A0A931BZF3_9ACTN|nr:trypsin-like peptidase domain-containing protein [Actinoplanes aureus]